MLEKILVDLNRVDGVTGSIILKDIFKKPEIEAIRMPKGIKSESIVEAVGSVVSVFNKVGDKMGTGKIENIMANYEGGKVLAFVKDDKALVAVADRSANLGLMKAFMTRLLEDI